MCTKKFAEQIVLSKQLCDEIGTKDYLVLGEPEYPVQLASVPDAPTVLFYAGDTSLLRGTMVAVVGTRQMSAAGRSLTTDLVCSLAQAGIITVSGLAQGVDAVAHQTALNAGAPTIAVLGTGITQPFPKRNTDLYNQIIETGLVLSEFYRTDGYDRFVFPRRNRIVAGLSNATVVTQAPEKSGALITARLAFDYGRDVFAFPYSPASLSGRGCNILIRDSVARLVCSAVDVLESLGYEGGLPVAENLAVEALQVLALVKTGVRSFEHLTESVNMAKSDLRKLLLSLELQGYIRTSATGLYSAM
ncbi:MAG: hypothetical protein TR69_WS6001000666 [candidate division WS6 bacterium OLB20]|uniref:Smf/DprA SLOG domain-containing protein n=1 Tax=candidate division WS6 bacterium OLB20 TaxID=1617426 RepID=A0A136LYD0_9BACT|nr:MAG: hypothetical protein TR69_WS6001000666 [candidate division WS6 bacterium OLB20]